MSETQLAEFLEAVMKDWRTAGLDSQDQALCEFAEKLTRKPASMTSEDVGALRQAGFSDEAIHDAIQVIAYFNYINRVADAVRVELEPEMPAYPDDTRG